VDLDEGAGWGSFGGVGEEVDEDLAKLGGEAGDDGVGSEVGLESDLLLSHLTIE